MKLSQKRLKVLESLQHPTKQELKEALISLDFKRKDVDPMLRSPEGKPYFRKLIYQNDEVELLVMNWSQLECAPHDHGESQGWIQVLTGTSLNTVFEVNENGLPSELFKEIHHKGTFFYAPTRGVHKMKTVEENELVTLHLYSPPITGMKVYDLEKCTVCIVADDCGAWWPDDMRQKVDEIKLKKDLFL